MRKAIRKYQTARRAAAVRQKRLKAALAKIAKRRHEIRYTPAAHPKHLLIL